MVYTVKPPLLNWFNKNTIGQVLTEMGQCQNDKRFSWLYFGSVTWHKRFRVEWNGKWLIVSRKGLALYQSTHRKMKWFSVTTKGLVQTEMV